MPKSRTTLLLAAALSFAAGISTAQEIPADPVLRDFEPLADYTLVLDGAAVPEAELYRSQVAGSAVLIVAPGLPSPVLVSPRKRVVEGVGAEKVVHRDTGTVDILSDAQLTSHGGFVVETTDVTFEVAGHAVRLEERDYLLGLQDTAAMLADNASYRYLAAKYEPSGAMLRRLGSVTGSARVLVYFGTWCPHCKDMLPRLLRVATELDGAGPAIEYFGFPRMFGNEPEARRDGVTSVPTGIVYRDGVEVGRLTGADWKIPELSLQKMLAD